MILLRWFSMKRYAVTDIGSNTVVLLIYEYSDKPVIIYHESEPVHLIGYHDSGHMREEGITKTTEVLKRYKQIIDRYQPDACGAFITEPWRHIDNAKEMLQSFRSAGIPVLPLSGREEAELDYLGTRIDCAEIKDGAAFDIGGGSSEFISFHDGKITEAVSIPMGCVRLSLLSPELSYTDDLVSETLQKYPLLCTDSHTLIGIGGTVRAFRRVCRALYGISDDIPYTTVLDIYTQLKNGDEKTTAVMREIVSAGRQSVFVPGMTMLVSIMKSYGAEVLHVSRGCVREGYLFRYLLHSA